MTDSADSDSDDRTWRTDGSGGGQGAVTVGAALEDTREALSLAADPDVTSREAAAIRRASRVARLLDEAVRVPGTDFRIGLDPIIGVLPVAGDSVAAALSLYPVLEAYRLDASRGTLAKMLALVGIDAFIGSIPALGPVFDAFWKANEWNVRALERHVRGE
ncbi:DUF4112 domain-containing protein [Halorientalis halophila]|uniref:DUF4112 domain-containing protein n=1 Tax=Halorientalis halophila TaxID=3108499 RepID=UPI0030083510